MAGLTDRVTHMSIVKILGVCECVCVSTRESISSEAKSIHTFHRFIDPLICALKANDVSK